MVEMDELAVPNTLTGTLAMSRPFLSIGGTLASCSYDTGECTFDWPLIEATAADEGNNLRVWARLLLAAREAGRG